MTAVDRSLRRWCAVLIGMGVLVVVWASCLVVWGSPLGPLMYVVGLLAVFGGAFAWPERHHG